MSSQQTMTVQWGNVTLDAFKTSSGVKPKLFTLYVDILLFRLKSCGFGCYIGQLFVGALGYADDILAPAVTVGETEGAMDSTPVFFCLFFCL